MILAAIQLRVLQTGIPQRVRLVTEPGPVFGGSLSVIQCGRKYGLHCEGLYCTVSQVLKPLNSCSTRKKKNATLAKKSNVQKPYVPKIREHPMCEEYTSEL